MEEKDLKQEVIDTASSQENAIFLSEKKMKLESQFKNGTSWFYSIAGLSIANSIITLIGSNWNFIVGLVITQIIDAIAFEASAKGKIIALIINILIAGVYAFLGLLSSKGRGWVFILGIALYGIDALLFIIIQDWISIAFHLLAIYGFIRAIIASKNLKKLENSL